MWEILLFISLLVIFLAFVVHYIVRNKLKKTPNFNMLGGSALDVSDTNGFDYVVTKPNGKPLRITMYEDILPVNCNIDEPALILLQDTAVNYDVTMLVTIGSNPRFYEEMFKDKTRLLARIKKGSELMTAEEARKVISKAPSLLHNLTVKTCDHSREINHNSIFCPYMLNDTYNQPLVGSSRHLTLHTIMKSRFYNPKKPNDYYKRLINDYVWKNKTDYKRMFEKFINKTCIEAFDMCTFEVMNIHPNVRAFFSKRKLKDYSNYIDEIFNDIPMLDQLEREITNGSNKRVCIYGDIIRVPKYVAYLSETHKLKLHNVEIHDMADKLIDSDTTSDIAKLQQHFVDTFIYDDDYLGANILKWHMRDINELGQIKKSICHEEAYYYYTKIDKKYKPRIIYCRRDVPITNVGSNHSILIFERNGKPWVMDWGYILKFESMNDVIKEYLQMFDYLYDITDKIKPGMTINEIDKCGTLIGKNK